MSIFEDEMEQIYTIVEDRFPAYSEETRELVGDTPTSELTGPVLDKIVSRLTDFAKESLGSYDRERLRGYIKQAEDFQLEVERMPAKDRLQRYRAIEKKRLEERRAERQARAEEIDAASFFSHPRCDADFVFWSKQARWTEDQAVALSLGKAPEQVNVKTLGRPSVAMPSLFKEEYRRRLQLVEAAVKAKDPPDLLSPAVFCAWVNRLKLEPELPAELRRTSIHPQEEQSEWKEKYEAANENLKSLEDLLTDVEKIPPKSKITFYRMILGMAVARYSHGTAPKKGAAKGIAGEMKEIGLAIDEDVVRERLNEAAAFLNYEISEPIRREVKSLNREKLPEITLSGMKISENPN